MKAKRIVGAKNQIEAKQERKVLIMCNTQTKLNIFIMLVAALFVFIGNTAFAACPSADLTGDCFVGLEDFAVVANQWLTGDPNIPDDMTYIPDGEFGMGDHFDPEVQDDELPVHAVLLDAFFMSKYEITNQQYSDYLNDANSLGQIKVVGGVVYASSDDPCDYPYCDTHSYSVYSQIDPNFSVRTKGGRDMSDDPMVQVSWYGTASYCNWRSSAEGYESCYNLSTWECDFSKHGYRLPTEAEWEYAARGGLHGKRFPWADPNISHSQANYRANFDYAYDLSYPNGYHPDWDDVLPYTSVVGSFSPNGYGLYDMTGNVFEWCNDWYDYFYYDTSPYDNPTGPASGSWRVLRGGGWIFNAYNCRVASRGYIFDIPGARGRHVGFRIVLDLE